MVFKLMSNSKIFEDIVDAIGHHDARLLCDVMGGCVVTIPNPGTRGGDVLAHVIGHKASAKMSARFAGVIEHRHLALPRIICNRKPMPAFLRDNSLHVLGYSDMDKL